MQLAGAGDTRPRVRRCAVECRLLMRVLAVAQLVRLVGGEDQPVREVVAQRTREPAGDRGVIGGGPRIGLGGHLLPQIERRGAPIVIDCGNQLAVVFRVGDHRHIAVVLGRRADHRRPADIDILDHCGDLGAGSDSCLEGIEVDHHQVDGADLMLGHGAGVIGIVAHRQEAAVDLRMQGLDAAVHHLREARVVGDLGDRDAGLGDGFGRAPGRENFDAMAGQRLGQLGKTGLVGNR